MMDNRTYDKKIDLLVQQLGKLQEDVNEIKQRQMELTIPKLTKIEKCLFGNGDEGLLEEHAVCRDRIKIYEKISGNVSRIIATLIIYFIIFAGSYTVLAFQVKHLWMMNIK
jgi:hypothetical protein